MHSCMGICLGANTEKEKEKGTGTTPTACLPAAQQLRHALACVWSERLSELDVGPETLNLSSNNPATPQLEPNTGPECVCVCVCVRVCVCVCGWSS